VKRLTDAGVDKFDYEFNGRLEARRHAGVGFFGNIPEQEIEGSPQNQGPENRVHVERPEAHGRSFLSRMGQAPTAIRVLPEGQILQMVPDVFTLSDVFAAASHSKSCFLPLFPNWRRLRRTHPVGVFKIVKIQVLAINFLLPREELSRHERNPPGTRVLRILTQSTFLHLSNR